MVKTNIQTFTGEVEILSNLHLGDGSYYMTANADASNVIQVTGNVGATFFVGDGGFLSNIATTLSDIVDQGNTVSNVVQFSSDAGVADYKGVGIVTDSNVGIQNTSPDHTLSIADIVVFDKEVSEPSASMNVYGKVYATRFEGDGGLLSNIATTLQSIVDQGNVSANVVQFNSATDYAGAGIITRSNVGIQNTDPVFNLSVGSNLHVDDEGSNVLVVHGNVAASNLNLGVFTVSPSHDLDQVCAEGNTVTRPVRFSNVITGISAASNIESAGTFISTDAERGIDVASNIDIGGRLKFDSNVFIDTLRVADIAANIVTYDSSTGELLDSSGTFMNKFAVVSEQPPSDFFANTTTVTNHGTYTLTTSNLATNSNTFNAFDGTANAWVSGNDESSYIGGSNVFHQDNLTQLSNLHPTQFGDWLAIEFPYKTTLRHMKITPLSAAQFPISANLYATNNDITWSEIKYWKDVIPASDTAVQTITVDATEQFKKYALVATKSHDSSNVAIKDWQLFTESFSIDGGKVAMAQQAATGGETVMDQSGPHGRGAAVLKKYPEIVFAEGKYDITEIVAGSDQYWDGPSTVFQGGYSLKSSQHSTDSGGQFGWMAFDENPNTNWKNAEDYDTSGNYDYGYTGIQQRLTDTNSTNHDGDHVIMGSPSALKMAKVTVTCKNSNRRVVNYSVLGSNSSDTTGWTLLDSGTFPAQDVNTATISSPTSYFKYHAFVVRSVTAGVNGTRFQINSIDFYGYEEDPPAGDTSVDTTFTSIMNTPQTTGANVYVDAKLSSVFTNQVTGPTPVGTNATHDNTNKYWEMNGQLTSNITVEANTFLEGDQPHAVSVWFNSSNLESNVSNTCVFSISDQEHLNSQNLDLQSNTWHNLTYAYQGEGGSRVTYLDGRKVAEDQAEDTFGEYPPFAMTGYSQGGYVVSASAETSGFEVWKAFNNEDGSGGDSCWSVQTAWTATDNFFNGTTSVENGMIINLDGVPNTTVGGIGGHWVNLEIPHKLVVNYVEIYPRYAPSADWDERVPEQFYIVGSNDGYHWYTIHHKNTNGVPPIGSVDTQAMTGAYSNVGFKNIRMYVTKIGNGKNRMDIGIINYYGHRENDLVHLPDPTHVLKYPHIAMTGPAQRGYVASASSNFDTYNPWEAFDNNTGGGWISVGGTNYSGGSGEYNKSPGSLLGTISGTSTEIREGEFLQIETPHKITVNHILLSSGSSDGPTDFKFWGSNDGSVWSLLHTEINHTNATSAQVDINSSVAYKYHAIVISKTRRTTQGDYVNVRELELYGTGVDSVPIQIGGGNIDKVANFRVYNKFVEEDQALEIWNAQKDEFGRAKSSMTLHKGRLGIGTTEPEGRLAVADEPHNLEEFPPRALKGKYYATSSYDSSIPENSVHVEGHGIFTATASSHYGDPSDSGHSTPYAGLYGPIKAFDRERSGNNYWYSHQNSTYTSGTGEYTGTRSLGGVSGEWIKLEKPYKTILSRFSILTHESYLSRAFKDFVILGSNDDENWETLATFSGTVYTAYTPKYFNVVTTKAFKYYGFVCTNNGTGGNSTNIKELRLFGTREQGQSVLHDGQLTLTKNLTVPRIGPALDADDTPRRDRLVVEYNTSTNPTFEGAVRDTSGRGNDGVFYGGASYDPNDKALVFDGGGDYIEHRDFREFKGNQPFTVSMWFKKDDNHTGTLLSIAPSSGESIKECIVLTLTDISTGRTIDYQFFGSDYRYNPTLNLGSWHHVTFIYSGGTVGSDNINDRGGRDLYFDGVLITPSTETVTTGDTLNLPDDLIMKLGERIGGSNDLDGSISNFKLYDCALTAEEVKTLYDMGRCDEGHHVVNFSKTRVGIGLGDGEAPRGALDVRGDLNVNGLINGVNLSSSSFTTGLDIYGASMRARIPVNSLPLTVPSQGGIAHYQFYLPTQSVWTHIFTPGGTSMYALWIKIGQADNTTSSGVFGIVMRHSYYDNGITVYGHGTGGVRMSSGQFQAIFTQNSGGYGGIVWLSLLRIT